MTKEEFEKTWLHNKKTFEEFETNDLKYNVWQYYRMHLTMERAVRVLDDKIANAKFYKKEDRENKPIWISFRNLLNEMLNDMEQNHYMTIDKMYNENRLKELNTLENLTGDKDRLMLASSTALCDYSSVTGKTPDEILLEFPYIDYLKDQKEEKEIERIQNHTQRRM